MKKSDIFLILFVLIIIVVGVFCFNRNKDEGVSYELPLVLSGDSGLFEISYSEYKDKVDSLEPFIFIVERDNCSHCLNFMPVVKEFVDTYNIPIYYLNTNTLSADEFSSFEKSNSFFRKNRNNWGTPTTIILVGNEAVSYLEGESTIDGFYDFLSDYIDFD